MSGTLFTLFPFIERGFTVSFAGIDSAQYPGDKVMTRLYYNTNLDWVGYYLISPWHLNGKHSEWTGKRAFLRKLGWGFAPTYVGQQQENNKGEDIVNAKLTAKHGTQDGKTAAEEAKSEGFPIHSVIYLDIEGGNKLRKDTTTYYTSWCQAVFDNHYYPGVYCGPAKAPALMKADSRPMVWIAAYRRSHQTLSLKPASLEHPSWTEFPATDPSASGYAEANMWQWIGDSFFQETIKDHHGHRHHRRLKDDRGRFVQIDLNSSDLRDPSRFLVP